MAGGGFGGGSPSLLLSILKPLCFQMMRGGGELTTSQVMMASSPSLNSCGLGAFLKVIFSVGGGQQQQQQHLITHTQKQLELFLSGNTETPTAGLFLLFSSFSVETI